MAWNMRRYVGESLICLCTDSRDGAVGLIECPDGICAVGEEAWIFADGYLQDRSVGRWIDFGQDIVFGRSDPDKAVGEEGTERPRRDGNCGDGCVGCGINARQDTGGICHEPNAAGADGDATLRICRTNWDRRLNHAGVEIGTYEGAFSAARNPDAAKADCEPGTWFAYRDGNAGLVVSCS